MSQFRSSALNRNPGIDCLRGLSIVFVILNHIGLRMRLSQGVLAQFLPKSFLNSLNFNGSEAVYIFFVISGFLITSNSLARWGSLGAIQLRTFYVRRAARILPCLLVLITVLSVLHLARVPGYVIDRPDQSLPRAILSAIGLHLNWYEASTWYLPANWDILWSLSIEEIFYLGFPLVCLLVRKDWILAPALAILALSLPISLASIVNNPIWKEKAYLPGMAAIALGVLGALIAARYRPKKSSLLLALQCFGACGIIAVLFFELKLWPLLGNGTLLLLTFSAISLILAFHWRAIDNTHWAIRHTAWLQSFGRLSYEIYLTHMFVVLTVVRIFRNTGASLKWGVLWYIPVFVLSWLLGWAVAKYLSTPSDRFIRSRFITSKQTARSAAIATGVNNELTTDH
jgi:peptidoglycan/LPS O-acetylase OafA/YrhL